MTTQEILEAARAAKTVVALASSETRTHALWAMSDWLCHPENMEAILAANAEDMAAAKGHISDVMLDRLALTEERIETDSTYDAGTTTQLMWGARSDVGCVRPHNEDSYLVRSPLFCVSFFSSGFPIDGLRPMT